MNKFELQLQHFGKMVVYSNDPECCWKLPLEAVVARHFPKFPVSFPFFQEKPRICYTINQEPIKADSFLVRIGWVSLYMHVK